MKLINEIENILEEETVSGIHKEIIKKVKYDKLGDSSIRSKAVTDSAKEVARIIKIIKTIKTESGLEVYDDFGIKNVYAGSLGARSVAEITTLKKKDGTFVNIVLHNKNFRDRNGKQL